MELKQVAVQNQGMSQDVSISKQAEQTHAFENHNIRIQATDDNTLLTVTNIKGPKQLELDNNSIKWFDHYILGKCITPNYLVLFTLTDQSDLNYILRIDLADIDKDTYTAKVLYCGDLNFNPHNPIDTLYYEEGLNVKKVYWVDSTNYPRVINLITPDERKEGGTYTGPYSDNIFDFYPVIGSIPEFNIKKNHSTYSQLPTGIIQYFISYYWYNGAETLIANASDTFTIDYYERGGKADETGMCAFEIQIPASSINTDYDYFRIYSARRTSQEGPITLNIVKDVKIEKNPTAPFNYSILDNGVNQETLDASQLYFIGGTPFIAKTLTQKDNTLFLGNLETQRFAIKDEIKRLIEETFKDENKEEQWSSLIEFTSTKYVNTLPNQFNSYYPYKRQVDYGSSTYKTFKSGEIYRFGIQYQNEVGQWSEVIWVGDKECKGRPKYDEKTHRIYLNDALFDVTHQQTLIDACKDAGYVNYRILIADPEVSNGRKIKAQGVLCPTLFTPGQRALNTPYALPSWIMRPRKGKAAYHHFEPIHDAIEDHAELASYFPGAENNGKYTLPFVINKNSNSGKQRYMVTVMMLRPTINRLIVRTVIGTSQSALNNFYDSNGDVDFNVENYYDWCSDIDDLQTLASNWQSWFIEANLPLNILVGADVLLRISESSKSVFKDENWSPIRASLGYDKNEIGLYDAANNNVHYPEEELQLKSKGWADLGIKRQIDSGTDWWQDKKDTVLVLGANRDTIPFKFKPEDNNYKKGTLQTRCFINVQLYDNEINSKIRNSYNDYFIDEHIVTLHSPEINDSFILGTNEYKTRIVGVIPLHYNYSDAQITTADDSYMPSGGLYFEELNNYKNEIAESLHSAYIYADGNWNYSTNNKTEAYLSQQYALYKQFLWHFSGSLIGATPDDATNISTLKTKKIFNHLFSNNSLYFDNSRDINYDSQVYTSLNDYLNISTNDNKLYYGTYDNLIIKQNAPTYHIEQSTRHLDDTPYWYYGKNHPINVRIKFSSTPHCVLQLSKDNNFHLLPRFEDEIKYDGVYTGKYKVSKYFLHEEKENILKNISSNEAVWKKWTIQELKDLYEIDIDSQISFLWNSLIDTPPVMDAYLYVDSYMFNLSTTIDEIKEHIKTVLSTYNNSTYVKWLNDCVWGIRVAQTNSAYPPCIYPKYKVNVLFNTNGSVNLDSLNITKVENDEQLYQTITIDGESTSTHLYFYLADKGLIPYIQLPVNYKQETIETSDEDSTVIQDNFTEKPYLFLAEIYQDIPYSQLYGGTQNIDLRKLNWLPCSKVTPITVTQVTGMEGDTYYQRWDCLKTYPTTEEDVNQLVDITSFMVETHINLDERTDVNRAKFNIMSRPTNFNLFNSIYNFKNDLFQYSTSWNDLENNKYPTQVTWSLTKNYLADVDSWTNISLGSITNAQYPVTKLVNYNNEILTFTEHSIEMIKYNAQALAQIQDGTFLELANASKVDGTVRLQYPYGTHNMSILTTENGMYFIEDNENSLIKLSPSSESAIQKIALSQHLDAFFKHNIIQGTKTAMNDTPFHLEYDSVHKDIYIVNCNYCLVYNENLQSFTSFIDFENTEILFCHKGALYSVAHDGTGMYLYRMFDGEYNKNYSDTIGYSVEYRINPGSYSDKVFTNINVIADTDTDVSVPNKNRKQNNTQPFDDIRVWTEYQDTGKVVLNNLTNTPSNLKQKFRTWRLNIPRDGNQLGGDRIRNPWMFVKLSKNKDNVKNEKFEFHTMTVQYME